MPYTFPASTHQWKSVSDQEFPAMDESAAHMADNFTQNRIRLTSCVTGVLLEAWQHWDFNSQVSDD
ncbi:Staphylocoagulase [Clarias magur]|uniref:Staphylocoagulase n=1 Tax=Clarias magur TaxID=1594786 RepID=A0A8J4UEI0_CLAMG|nr:Staphylocoagulase [Clarias magur]